MSLFGTSPPEDLPTAVKSRSSLFDDESTVPGSKSSLFADDDVAGDSPWAMPAPKKAARGELIKKLLPASDVPESYVDIYDNVSREDGSAGGISANGVERVLKAAGLSASDKSSIQSVVSYGEQDLGRNEFNVLLALIALAQENEDITLDSVDERRRNLPEPKLPSLTNPMPNTAELAAKPAQRPASPPSPPKTQPVTQTSPERPRSMQKKSLEFPEADPWGSPAMHVGHNHISAVGSNGDSKPNGSPAPVRTTSSFTTASHEGPSNSSDKPTNLPEEVPADGWGSYDNAPFDSATSTTLVGEGFGAPTGAEHGPATNAASRSFGGSGLNGPEETIIITLLPEKEGMFMFQHHNYQVSSPRRSSKVVRRYSDFVWLLDCLQKRYPFRQLPLLPPKRVGVNGSHLAADSTFIEKRRRGLSRFTNALARHPVLNQEQLVIMFLTVPTHQELAVWRKQATISVQEEFVGKTLPPGLEDSLPSSLNDLFDKTRSGVRRSAEIYINACNLLDRLAKRNEGLAADHLRLSLSLQTLTDATQDTYATDTNDVPLINTGLHSTAKHLSNSQNLLEDEAKAWDEGVLEDLKRQRDALVSMREMFDRRDRYDKDNIPYLERRIQNSENKLAALQQKPEHLVKPGEKEKVAESIIKDKEAIVAQHARGVFIKECIRDELIFFQESQYHVSRWNQDWAQERVKYSELQAENWRQLYEDLESMPLGD